MIQINIIKDEKGGIITNITEIQRIIKNNYELLCTNKWEKPRRTG
jgi:hypothetical protein